MGVPPGSVYSNSAHITSVRCFFSFHDSKNWAVVYQLSVTLETRFEGQTDHRQYRKFLRNRKFLRIVLILRNSNMSKNACWLVNIGRINTISVNKKYKNYTYLLLEAFFNWKDSSTFSANHGYKNPATQSSRRSIMFYMYDTVHWSKNAAMSTQFLSSLLERASTNDWPPWHHYMSGMPQRKWGR